ncbi:MAG: hypothetical protein RJB55_2359 [Verrucomicrobiota bacterium]
MRAKTFALRSRPRTLPGGSVPEFVLLGDGAWLESNFGPALVRLHRQGEARVTAAVDLSVSSTSWLARDFPRLRTTASLDAIDAPPDAVVLVASALRYRSSRIAAALRRGWHVLSACPPAENAAEASRLCELARQHEVTLTVDLPHRMAAGSRWLRAIAGGRALGACLGFQIEEGRDLMSASEIPPCGAWIDPGVRVLDLITGWFGPLQPINAADDAMGGFEAVARTEMSFGDGCRGTIRLDRDWKTAPSYRLFCRRGLAIWNPGEVDTASVRLEATDQELTGALQDEGRPSDRRELQLRHLLGALVRGHEPSNHAASLLPALELADQLRRIRTSLSLPWFSPNESTVAHTQTVSGRAA